MAGKVGHPKRPRSEAATFGRLVEAEREAGACTLGQARERVWKSDKKRWGSERKREDLWAEFKQIKQDEAAAAQLVEQMSARLAAFERASAEQGRKFQAQIDAIEADFARKNPHLAGLNERWPHGSLHLNATWPRWRSKQIWRKIRSRRNLPACTRAPPGF